MPPEEYRTATYLFVSRAQMEGYLEPWYVDEHYLCIDGDGNRYEFVNEQKRIKAVQVERSETWKRRFDAMMLEWLSGCTDKFKARLGIAPGEAITAEIVQRVLADEAAIRLLAGG